MHIYKLIDNCTSLHQLVIKQLGVEGHVCSVNCNELNKHVMVELFCALNYT